MKKKNLKMIDIAFLFRYKTDSQILDILSQHIHNRPIVLLSIKELDRIHSVAGIAKNMYKRYRSNNKVYNNI